MDTEKEMIIIRASQNGPYITVKFEAKTKKRYLELKKYISRLLKTFSEIDWQSSSNVNAEALDISLISPKGQSSYEVTRDKPHLDLAGIM